MEFDPRKYYMPIPCFFLRSPTTQMMFSARSPDGEWLPMFFHDARLAEKYREARSLEATVEKIPDASVLRDVLSQLTAENLVVDCDPIVGSGMILSVKKLLASGTDT